MARPLSIKLRNWLWRWLPIVFGCHCRPDRSFRFRDGAPFPICARCTGELAGILAALATYWIIHPSAGAAAALLLPMLADGFLQLCTPYESGNLRRLGLRYLQICSPCGIVLYDCGVRQVRYPVTLRGGWIEAPEVHPPRGFC